MIEPKRKLGIMAKTMLTPLIQMIFREKKMAAMHLSEAFVKSSDETSA